MASTVSQDILFRIGTMGTSAANKNVAAFTAKIVAAGAAIAILTKGISDSVSSAQKFGQVLRANSTDMSLFNRDTAGLIDTTTALTKAVEFQNAEIRLSAEQMRAIGVAAADYAQKTGKDATTEFNKLTKAVITGRETGLIPYGIELSQTADKAAAAQEAIDALVDKTKDLTIETQTAEEALDRFNNTFGTIKDAEIDAAVNAFSRAFANATTEIMGGIEAMEEYEGQIHATNGAILEWKWTLEGFENTLKRNLDTIVEMVGTSGGIVGGALGQLISGQEWLRDVVADANEEYENQIILMTKQAELIRQLEGQRASEQKRIASEQAYKSWVSEYSAAHTKLSSSLKGSREEQLRAKAEFYKVLSRQPDVPGVFEAAGFKSVVPELEKEFFEPRLKRKGRGGREQIDFEITEAEAAEAERREVSPRLGDFAGGAGILGRGDVFDTVGPVGRGAGAGAVKAQEKAAAQARKEAYEAEIDAFEAKEQEKLEVRKFFLGEEQRLEEMNAADKVKLFESTTEMGIGFLGNLSKAQDSTSKKGFERQKALDYAQNITQTTLGATSAVTGAFRSLPFPVAAVAGPAMAASIIAAGARRGQQIRSQKFGGGGGSVPSASLPGAPSGDGGQSDTNITLNLQLSGQTLYNEMIRVNDLESQSGGKSFTTSEK